jgi:hypothetical protein
LLKWLPADSAEASPLISTLLLYFLFFFPLLKFSGLSFDDPSDPYFLRLKTFSFYEKSDELLFNYLI